MKWLEIIKRLGESTKDDEEKELLGDYFERLRTMVRRECAEEELEHRFCLMMAGYIMRYVTREIDYSKTDADYYIKFLKSRLNWGNIDVKCKRHSEGFGTFCSVGKRTN